MVDTFEVAPAGVELVVLAEDTAATGVTATVVGALICATLPMMPLVTSGGMTVGCPT